MGAEHRERLPIEVVVAITIFALAALVLVFGAVYDLGVEAGYKECLNDARLGKPPKYKLVETVKKWERVK